MPHNQVKKIGELLLEFNYITEEELHKAIAVQKENTEKRLGEVLVEMGFIAEEDLIQVLEFQLGVPHVDLANYILTPDLAQYIPEKIARRYKVVALEKEGEKLKVAMMDPSNLVAIDDLEMVTGLKIQPMIAAKKDIEMAITQLYSLGDGDTSAIFESLDEKAEGEEPELDRLKEMVEDAPIVRLTNLIISQAIQLGASDIHIEPQANKVRIRYRIDGVLRETLTAPKYSQAALISRLKIIADLDITQRRVPQDGRIAMNVKGSKIDMRISTIPTIFGEKVVIRLLTKDKNLIKIENLGFSAYNLARFESLINQPHGIILVTGPTGSGKSTTLIAALNQLNSPEMNIVTIEDPVEYQIDGINQIQANEKIGLTFAKTLRSILRQDPDIIMVGEIRDEETARIAVRAALTGHLVLSTLHTNDAVSSITRLVDMGLPPYLVAGTVKGVIAQRLVRKLCPSCREAYQASIDEQEFLQLQAGDRIYKAKGCNQCSGTGYRGRMAVHEVLVIDEKIKEMIVRRRSEQEIQDYALKAGLKTLKEDGILKVKAGYTSYEELVRVIV